MIPTKQILEDLWLLAYARSSLLEAQEWASELVKYQDQKSQSAYRALINAAIVAYARPFSNCQVNNKKSIPLKDVDPPQDLSESHRDLIEMRHKVIGHKDATKFADATPSPNVILVAKDSREFDLHTRAVIGIDINLKQNMIKLCEHFISHCDKESQRIFNPYIPEVMKLRNGKYQINLVDPPFTWIQPILEK